MQCPQQYLVITANFHGSNLIGSTILVWVKSFNKIELTVLVFFRSFQTVKARAANAAKNATAVPHVPVTRTKKEEIQNEQNRSVPDSIQSGFSGVYN